MYVKSRKVYHSFVLTIDEEQRFVNAILKRYGQTHGNIYEAVHEAVMQWIKRVERGK